MVAADDPQGKAQYPRATQATQATHAGLASGAYAG